MTDSEYIEWKRDNRKYPDTKQRGKFPVYAFGAVGKNIKTKLHIFPRNEHVNRNHYHRVIKEEILDKKEIYLRTMQKYCNLSIIFRISFSELGVF